MDENDNRKPTIDIGWIDSKCKQLNYIQEIRKLCSAGILLCVGILSCVGCPQFVLVNARIRVQKMNPVQLMSPMVRIARVE